MSTSTSEPNGSTGIQVAQEWPAVMLMGILTVGLGVVVLVWPSQTLTVVSVLLGLQLLVFGLYRLITAFAADTESRGLAAFVGILLMIAGVIVLRNPFETVAVLATILGVVWIVTGSIELVEAIANRDAERRGWLAVGGVISIVAGAVVVIWPAPTAVVVAWIAGFYLVVLGLYLAATALALRNATAT
jgi:uncharacterized membrane protein HdeD (DUF308 family)